MKTQCPHCNQNYDVDANVSGEIVTCQKCGQEFVVDPVKDVPPPVKPEKKAKNEQNTKLTWENFDRPRRNIPPESNPPSRATVEKQLTAEGTPIISQIINGLALIESIIGLVCVLLGISKNFSNNALVLAGVAVIISGIFLFAIAFALTALDRIAKSNFKILGTLEKIAGTKSQK